MDINNYLLVISIYRRDNDVLIIKIEYFVFLKFCDKYKFVQYFSYEFFTLSVIILLIIYKL